MREVRERSRFSVVFMRRIVEDVRVAICIYAALRAGERADEEGCGVGGWFGFWGLGVLVVDAEEVEVCIAFRAM